MSDKHITPLPWEIATGKPNENGATIAIVGELLIVTPRKSYEFHAPDKEDAAFIVLAVNNHEKLVEALEDITKELNGTLIPTRFYFMDNGKLNDKDKKMIEKVERKVEQAQSLLEELK